MKIIKNEMQKQNLSKFLYDIAKIIFGAVVIFQIIKPYEFKLWIFISGLIAMISFFFCAYLLDGKEIKNDCIRNIFYCSLYNRYSRHNLHPC